MNWVDHTCEPVSCRFTPRETVKGQPVDPDLKEHIGEIVELVAYWKMDQRDPYPGEWALGLPNGEIFGRIWIASGDVTVLSK